MSIFTQLRLDVCLYAWSRFNHKSTGSTALATRAACCQLFFESCGFLLAGHDHRSLCV
jgi:hypothetical protein